MKKLHDAIAYRGTAMRAFAAALMLGASLVVFAEDPAAPAASDDELFGAEETVAQAATTSKEAEGKSDFLKYDLVKIGGSVSGKAGYTSAWADPWNGNAQLFEPDAHYVTPSLSGKVTLVAKPSTDFGVNMDFRTSWPFTTSGNYLSSASYSALTGLKTTSGSYSIPSISVWSLYSKFNWDDKVYFSFGKQPIAWGVSRGPSSRRTTSSPSPRPSTSRTRAPSARAPSPSRRPSPSAITNNLYFYRRPAPPPSDGSD